MVYDRKFRKFTLITIGVLVVLFAIFMFFRKDDSIAIKGYDDKVHSLTDSQKNFMFKSLYSIVNMNMPKGESPNIDDALIREGSNFETFSRASEAYEGQFIVDIKSIQQSYQVKYLNPNDERQKKRGDVFVSCLPDSELIYGDFDCVDMSSEQALPLKDRLPYIDIAGPFKIHYTGEGTKGEMKLTISRSTPNGRKNALKWLRSYDIDPTDVVIDYFGYDNPFVKIRRDF